MGAGLSTIYDAADSRDRELLRRLGTFADISGVAVDMDGQPVHGGITERMIGISAAQMRAIPEVIAIAYGVAKAPLSAPPSAADSSTGWSPTPPSRPPSSTADPPRANPCPGAAVHTSRHPEDPLWGGTANKGLVVRVGDTVRRPLRATSASTHALLQHLADVGFDGAPHFLGIDDKGREVLSYLPGEAITPPYPAWALTDQALDSVARLLRAYHDAVSSFDPASYAWPRPVPARFRGDIVSHNDPNLDNIVFRDRRAVALIDFDLAGPGSRLWDVAAAARLWAPLRLDRDIPDARRGRALTRLRRFADAYGLRDADRTLIPEAVLHNHDWCYDVVRHGASSGHAGFTDYWQRTADRAHRTRRWYLRTMNLLQSALSTNEAQRRKCRTPCLAPTPRSGARLPW